MMLREEFTRQTAQSVRQKTMMLFLIAVLIVLPLTQPVSQDSKTDMWYENTAAAKKNMGHPRSKTSDSGLRIFKRAKSFGDWLSPSEFKFSTSHYNFNITGGGRGTRKLGISDSATFQLKLDTLMCGGETYIRSIYYLESEADLILIYEMSDDESGWGSVTRLNQERLSPEWTEHVPSFGIKGVVESSYVYFMASGYVAKLNLDSGKYVWQHKNLYKDYHFNNFELPIIEGDVVLFKEIPQDLPKQKLRAKTIKVQKQSGKILSIH